MVVLAILFFMITTLCAWHIFEEITLLIQGNRELNLRLINFFYYSTRATVMSESLTSVITRNIISIIPLK